MGKEGLEALIGTLDNWSALFTLLVVIGVGGELVVHVAQSRANRKLVELQHAEAVIQETEIARLNKDAAEARKETERFTLDIASANSRAALAEQHAAEANLELAKLTTPRNISVEQRKRISDKVRSFTGTQFDVALHVEPETQDLLAQIEDALTAAGWVEIDWKGGSGIAEINFTRKDRPVAGIVPVSGVIIQMHPEQVQELGEAAGALASALSIEGVAAKAQPGLGVPNSNGKAIHILVGSKPQ